MEAKKGKRRRVRRTEEVLTLLTKIYDVSFYEARKAYNKASGDLEQAKYFIKFNKMRSEMVAQ